MPSLHLSQKIIDFFYPVGSYYETSNTSFDPNTVWGGTWEEDSAGRDTIAYDSTQAEFNSVGKTGGSKYLQSHTHEMNNGQITNAGTTGQYNGVDWVLNGADWGRITTQSAGTGNSGNLQPYIVVKRWHRTA